MTSLAVGIDLAAANLLDELKCELDLRDSPTLDDEPRAGPTVLAPGLAQILHGRTGQ